MTTRVNPVIFRCVRHQFSGSEFKSRLLTYQLVADQKVLIKARARNRTSHLVSILTATATPIRVVPTSVRAKAAHSDLDFSLHLVKLWLDGKRPELLESSRR